MGVRQRRRGRGVPRRPGRAGAQLPAAAADPVRDGAARGASRSGSATRSRSGRRPRSRTCCGSRCRRSSASREQNVRVIAPDVGGGFGSKLQVTAEEVLAVLIGRRLGKPVKWTESRSEGNMTVHHGRDQWQRIKIAADSRRPHPRPVRRPAGRHGRLPDAGHARRAAARRLHVPGHLQDGRVLVPCTGVFTTKMPTDAYRGAGRPEATFAIERIMDELAARARHRAA